MKRKIINIISILALFGILVGDIILMVCLLGFLWNSIWLFFTEPGLPHRLAEILGSIGYLGLCCVGIIILGFVFGFIVTKIPPSWMGQRESTDDDYWYDNL